MASLRRQLLNLFVHEPLSVTMVHARRAFSWAKNIMPRLNKALPPRLKRFAFKEYTEERLPPGLAPLPWHAFAPAAAAPQPVWPKRAHVAMSSGRGGPQIVKQGYLSCAAVQAFWRAFPRFDSGTSGGIGDVSTGSCCSG